RSGREGEEVSVSDGRYKLIQRVGMRDLLFDLASDPGEKNDLSKSESGRLAALSGQVESWWASRRRIVSGEDGVGVLINKEEREERRCSSAPTSPRRSYCGRARDTRARWISMMQTITPIRVAFRTAIERDPRFSSASA